MASDLSSDLETRWTPSEAQDQAAFEELMQHHDTHTCFDGRSHTRGATNWPCPVDSIYTAHLLVNKEFGWWGEGVEVIALPGVFADRDEVSAAVLEAAREKHAATSVPVTGGYTWHRLPPAGEKPRSAGGTVWQTRWAVFEDILAVFPKPSWRHQ